MYDYNNFKNNAAGVAVGASTYLGAQAFMRMGTQPYQKFLLKDFKQYNESELKNIREAAQSAFTRYGLDKRGYTLTSVTEDNYKEVTKTIKNKLDDNKIEKYKQTIEKIKKLFNGKMNKKADELFKNEILKSETKIRKKEVKNSIKKVMQSISEGKNAVHIRGIREILVNMDMTPALANHEMGHAVNRLGINKFGKILNKIRHPFAAATLFIALIGIFKPKKQEGEKPNGIMDKTTTFIKNNAGKLTFAAMLPTMAEEGLASINANKMLKESNLEKSLIKKINKGNIKAWGTYVLGATILSQAARFAIYAHDKIVENNKK